MDETNKKLLAITDAIYIEKGISNLNKTVNSVEEFYSKIDSLSDREQLILMLKEIKIVLDDMKSFCAGYEVGICEDYGPDAFMQLKQEFVKQKIKTDL